MTLPNNDTNMSYIVKSIASFFTPVPIWVRTILICVIVFSGAFYYISEKAENFYQSIQKSPKEIAEFQDVVSIYKDSILSLKREKFSEQSMQDQKRIKWVLQGLESSLNGWNNITIWKIHDHGGPLNNAEPKFMSAIYSIEKIPNVDIKETYIERLIPTGYRELFQEALDRGSLYIPDITDENKIYADDTKDNMDYWGTKSTYITHIKTIGSGVLFLNVDFYNKNAMQMDALIKAKVNNAKQILSKLIYDVPESLKVVN